MSISRTFPTDAIFPAAIKRRSFLQPLRMLQKKKLRRSTIATRLQFPAASSDIDNATALCGPLAISRNPAPRPPGQERRRLIEKIIKRFSKMTFTARWQAHAHQTSSRHGRRQNGHAKSGAPSAKVIQAGREASPRSSRRPRPETSKKQALVL